jgi:hypothetical protein
MILNYPGDDTAAKGVIFSHPFVEKEAVCHGAREAFVDTNLTELADEIADVTKEEQ